MQVKACDPFVNADLIKQAGVEPVAAVEDLYRACRYVSLHVPATEQTKNGIGKRLLSLMPAGATLINTARKEVINEAELLQVFAQRDDFVYMTDIAPSDETASVLRAKYATRYFATPKKMGAQTAEANFNAGVAAANQIIGFFERGEKQFVVNGV
jgi:D-3-phosphoglycerate dehydrogenase